MQSPNLAIAGQDVPLRVVCDTSDFTIVCALMQYGTDGAERVVCYPLCQLKSAKRNNPVHDKKLPCHEICTGLVEGLSFGRYTAHCLYGPCIFT